MPTQGVRRTTDGHHVNSGWSRSDWFLIRLSSVRPQVRRFANDNEHIKSLLLLRLMGWLCRYHTVLIVRQAVVT